MLAAAGRPSLCLLLVSVFVFRWVWLRFGARTFHPPLSLHLLSLKRDGSEKRCREAWGEGPEHREMPPARPLHGE